MKKKVFTALLITIGVIGTFVLNYYLLEKILIPDPCHYHTLETNILFDIFYDTPSFNGDHPFPTIFNLIFTLTVGALLGWTIAKFIRNQSDRKNNST